MTVCHEPPATSEIQVKVIHALTDKIFTYLRVQLLDLLLLHALALVAARLCCLLALRVRLLQVLLFDLEQQTKKLTTKNDTERQLCRYKR